MGGKGIYEKNRKIFSLPKMGTHYARRNFLHASEQFILTEFEAAIRNRAILDVGVGGGRTAPALAALGSRYVGLDYSAEMIKQCQALYPHLEFRHGDAMNLVDFGDSEFDGVFFSANGIDYVTLPERIRMFEELARVLKRDGVLIFSSRNLQRSSKRAPYRFTGFVKRSNPTQLLTDNLKRIFDYLQGIYHYQRHRKDEFRGNGYALLAEPIHNFSTIMYCSTMAKQVKQLKDLGFSKIKVISFGRFIDDINANLDDPWFYYVAFKN